MVILELRQSLNENELRIVATDWRCRYLGMHASDALDPVTIGMDLDPLSHAIRPSLGPHQLNTIRPSSHAIIPFITCH